MMRCGGGGDGRGRGGVGGDLYNSTKKNSIDHDGRRRPTAATGPHSRLLSIQQSTNILFDRNASLKLVKVIINYVY
jgi:hypothetical protein